MAASLLLVHPENCVNIILNYGYIKGVHLLPLHYFSKISANTGC